MSGLFKGLLKRKLFSFLLILQLGVSLLYFFYCAAAIQSVFYSNIVIPKTLDADIDKILHLEVGMELGSVTQEDSVQRFKKFYKYLNGHKGKKIGTYNNSIISIDEMANEFESIEIDENIEKMKKISVSHGRKFIKKDYNSKICTGTKNKPISIILGSKIAREYGLKPGRILHDGEIEKYYKVVGILKEKSKWFMQSVSDGMITSLDEKVFIPKQSDDVNLHYYCVISREETTDKALKDISNAIERYNIDADKKSISTELSEQYKMKMTENKQWFSFSVIILIMTSIGISILVAAHIQSREYEIGIKMAVGYSDRKIMSMFLGEFITIAVLSFLTAYGGARFMLGNGYDNGIYSGDYVSLQIAAFGGIVLFIVFIPSLIVMTVKASRLQPKDLIGGRE